MSMPSHMTNTFFERSQGTDIINSTFNSVGRDQNTVTNHYHGALYEGEPGLRQLYQVISAGGGLAALHDSEARFPPPNCHPATRKQVLDHLSSWVQSDPVKKFQSEGSKALQSAAPQNQAPSKTSDLADLHTGLFSPVQWLYGSAGVGKSAIAQTLCERFDVQRGGGHLIASFFFSRTDSTRNSPKYLFLIIAYCLATFSGDSHLRATIDNAIKQNPAILQASIDVQFRELVVKPFKSQSSQDSEPTRWLDLPKVVVIDGLDECSGSEHQRFILSTILGGLSKESTNPFYDIPLRFFIASRPEPAIRNYFNGQNLSCITNRTVLDDSFSCCRDIEVYLRSEFSRIAEYYSVPLPWPDHGVAEELAQRASGQFIYASTVVKYVGDECGDPPERLTVILQMPLSDGEAFADLDALYRQILIVAPYPHQRPDCVVHMLAFMLLTSKLSNAQVLEQIFELPKKSVSVVLRGLHSVANISHESDSLVMYHKSFADFLQDRRRSKDYYINIKLYVDEFICRLRHLVAEMEFRDSAFFNIGHHIEHWDQLIRSPDLCFQRLLLVTNGNEDEVHLLETFCWMQSLAPGFTPIDLIKILVSFPKAETVKTVLQNLKIVFKINPEFIDIQLQSFKTFSANYVHSGKLSIAVSAPKIAARWCLQVMEKIGYRNLFYPSIHEKYAMMHCLQYLKRIDNSAGFFPELGITTLNIWPCINWHHHHFITKNYDKTGDQWSFLSQWQKDIKLYIESFIKVLQKWQHCSPKIQHLISDLKKGFYICGTSSSDVKILREVETLLACINISPDNPGMIYSISHPSQLAELLSVMRICDPQIAIQEKCAFISLRGGHNLLADTCMDNLRDFGIRPSYFFDHFVDHLTQAIHTHDLLVKIDSFLGHSGQTWLTLVLWTHDHKTPERIKDWLKNTPERLRPKAERLLSRLEKELQNTNNLGSLL